MKTFYIFLIFSLVSIFAFSQEKVVAIDSVKKLMVIKDSTKIIMVMKCYRTANINSISSTFADLSWIEPTTWTSPFVNGDISTGRVYHRNYLMKNASREEGIEYLIQKN